MNHIYGQDTVYLVVEIPDDKPIEGLACSSEHIAVYSDIPSDYISLLT